MNRLIEITTTGDVSGLAPMTGVLKGVTLTAGDGEDATLVLKSGGSNGSTLLTLAALQGTSAHVPCCAVFQPPLYAALTGTGAVAYVEV